MKRGDFRGCGSASGENGGVEALEVSDLQDAPGARGGGSPMSSRASAAVSVIGFSTSTCTPAIRKSRAMAKCAGVGVTTLTASTNPKSSR